MKDDDTEMLSNLFGDAAELPVIDEEIVPESSTDAAIEPQPIEDTPAEPVTEPVQTTEPVVEPPKADPGFVPLSAVLDEREKRQKAQKELDELRAKQAQAQERPKVPDQFLDPEGYQSYVEQQRAEDRWQGTLHTSALLAVDKHGQADVDAAIQWYVERQASDPVLAQAIRKQTHPVDYAVREYRKHQLTEGVTDWSDPAALADHFARIAAARAGNTPAPVQQQAQPAIPTRMAQPRTLPPASIVDKPSQPVNSKALKPKDQALLSRLENADSI